MHSNNLFIKLWTLGGLPIFWPTDQLSGAPCSNLGAGNQRFFQLHVHVHVSTIMQYLCIVYSARLWENESLRYHHVNSLTSCKKCSGSEKNRWFDN